MTGYKFPILFFFERIINYYKINSLQLTQTQFNVFIAVNSNLKQLGKVIFTGEPCFPYDYSSYLSPEVTLFNIYGSVEMHNVLYSKHDLHSFSEKGMLLNRLYPDINTYLQGGGHKKLYVMSKYNCQCSLNSKMKFDSGDYMIETNNGFYHCGRDDHVYNLSQLQAITHIRAKTLSVMSQQHIYFRNEIVIIDTVIYLFIEKDAKDIINFNKFDVSGYFTKIIFLDKFSINSNGKCIRKELFDEIKSMLNE